MSRAWSIATKELLQTRRDRLAALFTLVLPVVFTIVLGILIGGAQAGDDRLPVAIVNLDQSAAAQQLVENWRRLPSWRSRPPPRRGRLAVHDQYVAAALVIPEGFGTTVEAGRPATRHLHPGEHIHGSPIGARPSTRPSRDQHRLLGSRSAAEQVAIKTGRRLDETLLESARSSARTPRRSPGATVGRTEAGSYRPASKTRAASIISSTGSLVQLGPLQPAHRGHRCRLGAPQRALRRLASTGANGDVIVGGKMMAMVIITFLQQTMLIFLGQFAFGVDYFGSGGALLLTMISLSVLAASTGLLLSALFRSEQAVVAATVITAQLLAVLGGAWFPLEITSDSFKRIAHFFPSAWIMDSLHGIVLKDWGVPEVLGPLGIVWIWIAVLFGLAVWRFRPE